MYLKNLIFMETNPNLPLELLDYQKTGRTSLICAGPYHVWVLAVGDGELLVDGPDVTVVSVGRVKPDTQGAALSYTQGHVLKHANNRVILTNPHLFILGLKYP